MKDIFLKLRIQTHIFKKKTLRQKKYILFPFSSIVKLHEYFCILFLKEKNGRSKELKWSYLLG